MVGWGGFREGAGRKPSGKRKVNFYINEQEEDYLRDCLFQFRKLNYTEQNEYAEDVLEEYPSNNINWLRK